MHRDSRRRSGLACLVGLLAGCAPAAPPPPKPVPAKPPVAAVPLPEHPARWALEPGDGWLSEAHLDLGPSEGTLHVGSGGERWLVRTGKPATTASQLLPETLMGVVRLADKGFAIVGASGKTYLTHEPLGPSFETHAPPQAARKAAAGKSAILLLTIDNAILRSTDGGVTYAKVVVKSDAIAWSDLALSGDRGLLVGMPQRVLHTLDDGLTFTSIATRGTGAFGVYTGLQGELVLASAEVAHFEPSPPSFVVKPHALRTPKLAGERPVVDAQVFSGTHVFELSHAAGKTGGATRYSFGAARLGPPVKGASELTYARRELPALDGCKRPRIGALSEVVEIACEAQVPDPADPASLKYVTRLFRSTNAGAGVVEDGVLSERIGSGAPVVGPDGYLLFRGDCHTFPYKKAPKSPVAPHCDASFIRPPGSHELKALEGTPSLHATAVDSKHPGILALALDAGQLTLERLSLDGANKERVATLGPAGLYAAGHASLQVDDTPDSGQLITVVQLEAPRLQVSRSTDGGATFTSATLEPDVLGYGRSGNHVLAIRRGSVLESADGGLTFHAFDGPSGADVLGCNEWGCLTTRGPRFGWSLPGTGISPEASKPASPKRWATPLRCTTKGAWTDAGLGDLPQIHGIDPTAKLRVAMPRRKSDGAVDLALTDRAGKTTLLPLLGSSPKGAFQRWQTSTYVQPLGVIAVRYHYQRKTGPFGGGLSPVHADVAWFSFATGKVQQRLFPSIGTFRVQHDPQPTRTVSSTYPTNGDVAFLAPSGLYFRHPFAEPPIRLLKDGGGSDKFTPPEDGPAWGSLAIARVGSDRVVYDPEARQASSEHHWLTAGAAAWTHHTWTLWSETSDRTTLIAPVDLGGRPGLRVSFRGDARFAPAEFAVALEPKGDPGALIPIPTQQTLGDPPTVCGKPLGPRSVSLGLVGTRHPVLVEDGGAPIVLATDEAILEGGGSACVSSYFASTPAAAESEPDYAAIIAPDALGAATLFRADRAAWPAKLSTRPLDCTWAKGPLPKELADEPGF